MPGKDRLVGRVDNRLLIRFGIKVAKCGETFEKVTDNPRGKNYKRLSGFYVYVSVPN